MSCLEEFLDLVVEYEYKSTTSTTEDVGESALEEGVTSLGLVDRGPAVEGALVQDLGLGTSGLHHHTPTHGVEWIGHDTSDGGYSLRMLSLISTQYYLSLYKGTQKDVLIYTLYTL